MSFSGQVPVDSVRRWEADQTSRLLGDTISMSESEWHAPSLLPGWTRAHVATHLSRNADACGWAALNPRDGFGHGLSAKERFVELERGADRPGLQLQIDLDTSAGALNRCWNAVLDWSRQLRMLGGSYPLSILPLARLHEVCVHHLDLGLGATPDQIDPLTASWLLRWVLHRMESEPIPEVTVFADSGLTATIGKGGPGRHVSGTDARLWAWLSGRVGPDQVVGADGLEFDLLG
ncbi:MAG: maleylpyruvate isomerase family mycothiol-dependent enzyme [Propionibacteriaceae bacterium]|jgi:maleylpyruvate isomerase|nr:maleylpyruvate isomerase family mycothiol-dependent enzyme [Propionibacteriaceae bacterium]